MNNYNGFCTLLDKMMSYFINKNILKYLGYYVDVFLIFFNHFLIIKMYKIIQIDFELFVQEKDVSHKTHRCSLGKLDDKKSHIKIPKA
jgi:hypothetical protein